MAVIDFAILRSEWMIHESAIDAYKAAAMQYLAGQSISTGLFSKLSIPDVPNHVALVPINGLMTKADVCGGMGTRSLANAITNAAADPSKKSILLYFESVPGGQVDGTIELANAIANAKKAKPVIGAISGMCCSAGMWASSVCSEVYAMASTDLIGCIGVQAQMKKKASADAGADQYEVVVSDLSPHKNIEGKDLQAQKDNILNPMAKLFQDAVMSGRGDKLNIDAEGLLTGMTFVATKAKKEGLIDGVMPFERIVKRADYLTNQKNTSKMSANNSETITLAFQNVLRAAGATAAVPCEAGFALEEAQMNQLDAHILAIETTSAANATALQERTNELATANNTIASLTAQVAELSKKPAAIVPNPAAAVDPDLEDLNKPALTSADLQKQQMAKKYNLV